MSSTNPKPSDAALIAALQENYVYARHQEQQRERNSFLYWAAWAGAIGLIYSGEASSSVTDYPWLFLFLALLALPVLAGSLKWSAEFTNHIAAAEAAARELKLNTRLKEDGEQPNRFLKNLTLKFHNPLPYPEFKGYMAFPLKLPTIISIGAIIPLLHGLGFAISLGLFFRGLGCSGWLSLLAGILALLTSFLVCVVTFKVMEIRIQDRQPNHG